MTKHNTRTGKIARLPHEIRAELNRRLQDGEQGKSLIQWLNAHPLVQETLNDIIASRAINDQNLTEWKQGGYQDWLRQDESRALIQSLADQHKDLNNLADGADISDRFAGALSVEFIAITKKLLEDKTGLTERWHCLREVLHELSLMRRDDHRATNTSIKRDRWQRQVEREDLQDLTREAQDAKQRLIDQLLSNLNKGVMAEAFGGGEQGDKVAALLHQIKFNLPTPDPAVPDSPVP